ncbi:MAG TPA: ATP-binding protein, partial [Candidatus Wallbacteria bacterium]|nr:ATP-binding protein [Candidatus Wallbacteria bacterium]
LSRLTFASYVNIISELLFISCPCEFCSILWFDKKNTGYRIVAEKTVFERGGEKILSHYRDKSVRLIEQAIGTMGVISMSEPEGGAFVNCLAAPVMNFKQSTGGLALVNKLSGAEGETSGFTYNDQLITLILTNYLGDFYNGFLNTSNLENKIRSLSIIYSVAGAGNSLFETSDFERSIKKTLEEIAQYMKIRSCALAFYDSDDRTLNVYSSMEEDISAPITELLSSIKMDFWSSPKSGVNDKEFDGGNIINLSEVNIFKSSVEAFKSRINAPDLSGFNFEISLKPVSFHKQPCGYMIFFDAAACAGTDCGFILDESESEIHEFMSAASNILISLIKARKNYIKLNELEKVAARMERLASIGEVAAGVAHEIRNPLGGISLFATSLAAGFDDGDNRKKWLNQIIGAVGRIGKIVSSLLNFAREEIINKTSLDAVSIVGEAAASVQNGLPAGGAIKCSFYRMTASNSHDFTEPLKAGEKVAVKCDGEKLKQVFVNLAQNSINAAAGDTPENQFFCEVDVIFGRDDINGRTLIYFCDNGPGVPAEIREKIFRPFFTSRAKGTGLGLAITQKIMEAHSGGIRLIDSGTFENRGKKYGAIFELSLPD